ncbi:hypothetical protein QP551_00005 [Slackia exigua]|uniref:YcjF family protein n=1 Tax=Slackia exigua TaxID=84109 RepID=UPI00254ECD05|nr:hypothetical protein [Slackia exigua]MDK7723090.1 hypothetical protein [Slackia exigua]MDK7725283.1 hypothetical protein [Slackia exigua]
MNIPIDIKTLLAGVTDVEAARTVSLSVSVLIDDSAPADLAAFVRSSFASASPQARVSLNYFHDGRALFDPESDMVVIAAGTTPEVGQVAEDIRRARIPVMVVTASPAAVRSAAEAAGVPIAPADLIAPDQVAGSDVISLSHPVVVHSGAATVAAPDAAVAPRGIASDAAMAGAASFEPIPLSVGMMERLALRMGEWVVATFKETRLSYAQAFDFVRRPLALESVRSTAAQNAGVGLVVVIPGADMPVMTANQAKMVLEIAAAYGQPLTADRIKELAAIVGGGFAWRAVARQIIGVVPALGWAVKAGIGYGGTVAMGTAAIEYFERGGTVGGLVGALNEARGKAVRTFVSTSAGRGMKDRARAAGRTAAHNAAASAGQAAKDAPVKLARAAKSVAAAAVTAAIDSLPGARR